MPLRRNALWAAAMQVWCESKDGSYRPKRIEGSVSLVVTVVRIRGTRLSMRVLGLIILPFHAHNRRVLSTALRKSSLDPQICRRKGAGSRSVSLGLQLKSFRSVASKLGQGSLCSHPQLCACTRNYNTNTWCGTILCVRWVGCLAECQIIRARHTRRRP